jgi:o-succinylbenzoate synthase
VLLEVFDEEGRRGVGEASPLPGFSQDTLEECFQALTAWCRALPLAVNMFYLQKLPAVLPLPPAARFAVETALLDLQGRRGGVPLTRLLARELYEPIFVSKLLSGRWLGSLAEQVRRGLAEGFHTFKVKLGGVEHATEDVKLAQDLRAAVPGEWRLRVDLNGAWNCTQWERLHRGFADAGVELVEDPVPKAELQSLPGGAVPVAADEALKDEDTWLPLARSGTCSLWILKPTVLGGFQRCRQLSALAHSHGIETVVTHCFEGPVGLAAVRAVAQLCGAARHPDAPRTPRASRWDIRWQDCYAHGVDLHGALTAFPPLPVPGGGAPELYPWVDAGLGLAP